METANSQYKNANIEVFKFFNNSFGKPEYNNFMNLGAELGEQSNFYCYLMIALFVASLNIYNNKHDINTLKEILISWFTAGVTLFLSLAIGYAFILLIKNYTTMPRPFCSLDHIYIAHDITNRLVCNMSFPSGHIAFLTIIVASFWPLFNYIFKTFSIILVLFVAITRMASGAHYPVDLLGSVIITLPLTLYIYHKIAFYVLHYENKKNFINKLYNKLFN